eukprot:TRINITY_DN3579_c0_g1_i1.p1 TRINITY_DN3579_c0_g1~~TRINITY_DN3579_c0_g1_i1.p1  ORF type:complete len:486 (+),score=180.39 TRINITY_DN3579_c0_g1_i1:120-1577(+)
MLLDLQDTRKLVDILKMTTSSFNQIEGALGHFTRTCDNGGRLCLALRCMMMDNYYRTADQEYHAELLITAFVLHCMGQACERQAPQQQEKVPLPNTKSVLFLMLQQLEGEIRERRGLREDADALRQKTALKVFILQCISEQMVGPALARTPQQVLQMELPTLQEEHGRLQQQCRKQLVNGLDTARRAHEEEQKLSCGGFLSRGVTPVLVLPDQQGDSGGDWLTELGLDSKPVRDLRFDPVCDRPRPPPLALAGGELEYLYSQGLPVDLVWDGSMGSTPDAVLELRERVQKAHCTKLTSEEEQALLESFKQEQSVLLRAGISPQRFPELVERNPTLAAYVIWKLADSGNYHIAEEFLTALVHMDPLVSVCETLLSLHGQGGGDACGDVPELRPGGQGEKLTTDFVGRNITASQHSGKRRTGHTKLIAVFCTQLLRQGDASGVDRAPLLEPLLPELKSFCVEHAAIGEVSKLYKELQARWQNGWEGR